MAENDFSITLNPCSVLKKGVNALCDAEFNPKQWGFMEVGEDGGTIFVLGADKKLGFLNLKADGLAVFETSIRFKKMIDLGDMKEGLNGVGEDDVVTIRHIHGLNNLDVEIGSSGKMFAVSVLGDFPDYKSGLNVCYGFGRIEDSATWITENLVEVWTPGRQSNKFAGTVRMGPRYDMDEWNEELVDKVLELTYGTGKEIKLYKDPHGFRAICYH